MAGAEGAQGWWLDNTGGLKRSLRFNSADSAYLNRTPGTAGNRKTWTWAGWVKRSALGANQALFEAGPGGVVYTLFWFNSSDKLTVAQDNGGGGVLTETSVAVFRDVSAWYHIVLAVDTTQATAANRFKMYANGVELTLTESLTLAQNADTYINATNSHRIGYRVGSSAALSAYLADIHFIDGQALDPSSFGKFDSNGVWNPKTYLGTYGTNGFNLPFSNNSTASALGTDVSGNDNDWTVNNISVVAGAGNDSLLDFPINYGEDTGIGGEVRGNYATLNPISKQSSCTLANGNLDYVSGTATASSSAWGTINIPTSGKWYWEYTPTSVAAYSFCGISMPLGTSYALYYGINGTLQTDAGTTSGGATLADNDVVGVAVNVDSGTITFYKNGVSQLSVSYATSSGLYAPVVRSGTNGQTPAISINFGQRPFAYPAPSGFKALCTTNLAEPTIADGSTVMDVKLYTGNGSTQTISGLNFSPDFVWIKSRSAAYSHALFDTVRGVYLGLQSNATNSEISDTDALTAFTSDGFSSGSGNTIFGTNTSGQTFVAWTWDAGSSTVTNNDGSISSQVRANASSGFSVVTYTGTGANATVGHGLGAAPSLIITKSRNNAYDWTVYHSSLGINQYLFLNSTAASTTNTGYWNTAPTSTIFGVGNNNTGSSGSNLVAYCFAPVAGYSAMGSYVASSGLPYVYLGFRPRFVLIKNITSSSTGWRIIDSARDSFNDGSGAYWLSPQSSNAEVDERPVDLLSNGFKLRMTDGGDLNYSSDTYIYAAFAEHPFKTSRAR